MVEKHPFFETIVNSLRFTIRHHGYCTLDPSWQGEVAKTKCNILFFVRDGRGYYRFNDHELSLEPGHIYFIPLNSAVSYRTDKYLEKFFIHFNLELFSLVDLFEVCPPCEYCRSIEDNDIFNRLEPFRQRDISGIVGFSGYLLSLVGSFIGSPSADIEDLIRTLDKYRDLTAFIDRNLGNDLTLGKLSPVMSMSPQHLSLSFKRDTGKNLKEFINAKLIERAKREIAFTDMRVKEVASRLRFRDEFYFSRYFKSKTGYSPLKYRDFLRNSSEKAALL